jgi:hypothetical protein
MFMDVVAMEKRRPTRWIAGRRQEEVVGNDVVLLRQDEPRVAELCKPVP